MGQQDARGSGEYRTVVFEVRDHVATVTLNRPEAMNAFNAAMLADFRRVWGRVRADDGIHVVVLRAAGDRAFCTGVDVKEGLDVPDNPWHARDPGEDLSPKQNKVWKPVIAAVQGMVAGGAFYWLNDCDIIIAADHATFFDPHVSYGLSAVFEPMMMLQRMPLGEVMRMFLMGAHERMTARRAHEIGLVQEVVPASGLHEAAERAALAIASQPPLAVQTTVRAVWYAQELGYRQALDVARTLTRLGTDEESMAAGQREFLSGRRPDWRPR